MTAFFLKMVFIKVVSWSSSVSIAPPAVLGESQLSKLSRSTWKFEGKNFHKLSQVFDVLEKPRVRFLPQVPTGDKRAGRY